jgi:hypothetical protein
MTPEDEEFARIEAEIKRRQNDDDDIQEYAHQRQWVNLTDKELEDLMAIYSGVVLYRAIEAKLKEKNHD